MVKEEKKEEKKKRIKLRWQIKLLIIIILIITYSFTLATKGIFIKEFKVESSKIDDSMHGLKILQFSDLHYGSTVNIKTVSSLTKKINQTKPDVVIFTGDLIDENYKLEEKEKQKIIKELGNINAELGKYYVTGEEDFEEAVSILNLSGFENLNNNAQLIYNDSWQPILLIGKNAVKSFFESGQAIPPFKVLALHDPDDINEFKDYDFDLAMSGHTHNGQINIPKIKDLLIDSEYKNNYQKVNKTKLFVNPGIGTSKIKIRLFNHPTIYLYRLNKTA